MGKRAKEAAVKTYPMLTSPSFEETNKIIFTQMDRRAAYIAGYEQAEKDTIERAIEWLKYAQDKKISFDGAIAYFKAIMEEE